MKENTGNELYDIMRETTDKITGLATADRTLGAPVEKDGVTVYPISEVSVGFAGGGLGGSNKKRPSAGAGGKVQTKPVGFLVLEDGKARVMGIDAPEETGGASPLSGIISAVTGLLGKKKDKPEETEE